MTESQSRQALTDPRQAAVLIVRVRWFFLLLIGVYGLLVGFFFSFSEFGLFLHRGQLLVLAAAVAAFIAFSAAAHRSSRTEHPHPYAGRLQLLLDLLFTTTFIYFSGGAASWFWPVYFFVTLEAAIVLERRKEVLLLGLLGSVFFGTLLGAEYFDLLAHVPMPFVEAGLHHEATYLLLLWFWVALLNAGAAVIGAYLMATLRRENQALSESENRLTAFLNSANDLIFSFSPEGDFRFVNSAWQRTLGLNMAELSSRTIADVIHPEHRARCLAEFQRALAGETTKPIEGDLVSRDGALVTIEGNISCTFRHGRPVAVWGICRDVSERKRAQAQLFHLAHHDQLTGLPNRPFFLDRLRQACAMAKRFRYQMAVIFLDIDRFKLINDTLGHAVGDQLLLEVSRRLCGCVRKIDTVARFGGDEFTILLPNMQKADDAERVAEKIIKALKAPTDIAGHELFLTASMGIGRFPDDSDEPVTLIQKADIAMYHAKAQGRNNFQFYRPDQDLDSDRRLVLESGLRRALEKGEFRLFYQPQVEVASGRITALEALLRWEHPQFGLLLPGEFISLAEEAGQIVAIGEWVLQEACTQNVAWQKQGLPPVRMAVNISGYQLQKKGLAATVLRILRQTGMAPAFLELEITESVIMQNPDLAAEILAELRDLGIGIAIDDFGTGYSSLAHLKRFTVTTLKIDKAFVKDVEINRTDAAITTAIIAMGSVLNLKVTAEGVETAGQYNFFSERHCDEVQGFYCCRPTEQDEIADILRQGLSMGRGKGPMTGPGSLRPGEGAAPFTVVPPIRNSAN